MLVNLLAVVSRFFRNESRTFDKGWQSVVVAEGDLPLLCPITYVYDYLPHGIQWLRPLPVSINRIFSGDDRLPWLSTRPYVTGRNFIQLHPQAANLPLHTGLENFKQSVHWKANMEATRELLELFAKSGRYHDTKTSGDWQHSLARLAERLLRTTAALENTYSRFSIYMWANADERRIKLLAQSVILIFLFDGGYMGHSEIAHSDSRTKLKTQIDVWENAPSSTVSLPPSQVPVDLLILSS